MTFNFCTIKRSFCVGQHYRIDDSVSFNLSGDEHRIRQFLIGKSHPSAICKRSHPLVGWHSHSTADLSANNTPSSECRKSFSRLSREMLEPILSALNSALYEHTEHLRKTAGLKLVRRADDSFPERRSA